MGTAESHRAGFALSAAPGGCASVAPVPSTVLTLGRVARAEAMTRPLRGVHLADWWKKVGGCGLRDSDASLRWALRAMPVGRLWPRRHGTEPGAPVHPVLSVEVHRGDEVSSRFMLDILPSPLFGALRY